MVDDCSTDNSVSIVKSYLEKFGGRLKIYSNEKNFGVGATRNKALMLSRGEYVYFVDADDMITNTALEESYPLAKEYDVDVIHYPRVYKMSDDASKKKLTALWIYRKTQTNVLEENLADRIDDILRGRYGLAAWRISVRRDFLIENELFFPDTKVDEDVIRNLAVFIHAKRLLRIPNPIYVYRHSKSSITRSKRSPAEDVNFWLKPIIVGLKFLDGLLSKHKFIKENPRYHYALLKNVVAKEFDSLFKASEKLDSTNFYEAIQQEYGKLLGEHDTLIAALCTYVNDLQKHSKYDSEIVNKFNRYFTARMDIKLETQEQDVFQILSAFDERTAVWKPDWLQKDGIGYQIQSYAGNLELVAKAAIDGKLTILLRGLDVKNADKSARLPYWIDYTKFCVNEKVVFDTLTPAWHDKPYKYNLIAKADDEIKIQIEWLPHRSDT